MRPLSTQALSLTSAPRWECDSTLPMSHFKRGSRLLDSLVPICWAMPCAAIGIRSRGRRSVKHRLLRKVCMTICTSFLLQSAFTVVVRLQTYTVFNKSQQYPSSWRTARFRFSFRRIHYVKWNCESRRACDNRTAYFTVCVVSINGKRCTDWAHITGHIRFCSFHSFLTQGEKI